MASRHEFFVFRHSTGEIVRSGLTRAQARALARTDPDYQSSEYGFVGQYRSDDSGRHSIRIRKPTLTKIRRALRSVWLRTTKLVVTAKAKWCTPVGTSGRYRPPWLSDDEWEELLEEEEEEEEESEFAQADEASWLAGPMALREEFLYSAAHAEGVADWVNTVIGYLDCPDVKDSDVQIIDITEVERGEFNRKRGRRR